MSVPTRPRNGAGTDHGVMRELNRALVLDLLRHEPSALSRADIAKRSGLAKPTVSVIVEELLARDLVREVGTGRTTAEGGRPGILLEFNARSEHLVGVHVGVVHTNVVLADARGAAIGQLQAVTPKHDPTAALDRVVTMVRDLLRRFDVSADSIVGTGVCVPGLVDLHQGTCLLAPNLGWRDVPVSEVLQERLGCPVYVHNTAQACALAETVDGAAKGASEVALLYVGTGVGAGLIAGGQLARGWSGIAGEVGHCRIAGATDRCACGKVGCLETVASGPALVRAVSAASTAGVAATDIESVGTRAASGDRAARAAVASVGRELGLAASWLINLFNPEVLIVAGGLAELGELLLSPLRETALAETLPQAAVRVSIRPWALGQEAKVRGAVLVALQAAASAR